MSSFKHKLKFILSALKGQDKQFTSGSINRAILLLSIPMIAEMLMESLFAVVDVFFVSKVGIEAVATVGLTESVLMIIYSVAIGISMAMTAVVARRIGEKNPEKAAQVVFQGLILAGALGLVLGVSGFVYGDEILRLMGAEESLIQSSGWYTKIMFASNTSIILLFVINGVFRGAGDASIAMRSLWLANGINIVLDPLLILGWGPIPEMGVAGAAIATTIGRSTGVIYQVYHLFNGSSVIKLSLKFLKIRWETVREILTLSVGGMGQFLVETASWIFLVRVMSMFGASALAGYTIAFRVIVFTILPSWGMANAAATLVGQNLGANRPDRAEASVWIAAKWNMIFLGSISVLFIILAKHVLTIFIQEPEALCTGVEALRIICIGYIFFAYGMVISQSFNGAGDTRTPLLINMAVFWVLQIPLAYFLAVTLNWEARGVFISIALCHSIHALVCMYIFRKGKWKTVKV
ncbi:MAG: putative MATE family efflux protein [Cyclobacteriaceae bacterium]|jgi:putative MATE family efflux protein